MSIGIAILSFGPRKIDWLLLQAGQRNSAADTAAVPHTERFQVVVRAAGMDLPRASHPQKSKQEGQNTDAKTV